MGKRGQATGIIIIGLVVVAVILILLFYRGQFIIGPVTKENIQERFAPIREHIKECITDASDDQIRRIGLQGGYLKTPEDTFRMYGDVPISILCYNIAGKPQCMNRMLTEEHMEDELKDAIKNDMSTCLNLGKFKRGFEMTTGKSDLSVDIREDVTVVTLNMPVTIRRNDISYSEDKFESGVKVPLGRLFDAALDIVDVETEFGDFDQLAYMLAHKGQYVIEKKKPYPDKLYVLKSKDSDYVFQFFIQDEPS